jgi:hypothetical protein
MPFISAWMQPVAACQAVKPSADSGEFAS